MRSEGEYKIRPYGKGEHKVRPYERSRTMADRKVAFITGGSRGIGLGIARALAGSGFDVAINGRREASEVEGVLNELRSAGVEAIYLQGDIAELDDHARMLDQIRARLGRLDVLVNNAGVAPNVRADILDASPESFDRLMSINLRGPYFLTQAAARWMAEQRKQNAAFHGCIVNVSSVSATVVSTNRGDYCISKAGIAMATQLWAARLAEFGIDVYEVRPGVIATDMTAGVKEKYDHLIANGLTVERRWGRPEDVGSAVAVLARGDLPYATGQILNIDGGMTIQRL
jgi:NAD(P)-dependent dehydrogenase (short-subunit alcohol dehydrogenase family)